MRIKKEYEQVNQYIYILLNRIMNSFLIRKSDRNSETLRHETVLTPQHLLDSIPIRPTEITTIAYINDFLYKATNICHLYFISKKDFCVCYHNPHTKYYLSTPSSFQIHFF